MNQNTVNELVNNAIQLINEQHKELNNSFELFNIPVNINNKIYFIIQEVSQKYNAIRPFDIMLIEDSDIEHLITRVTTEQEILSIFKTYLTGVSNG